MYGCLIWVSLGIDIIYIVGRLSDFERCEVDGCLCGGIERDEREELRGDYSCPVGAKTRRGTRGRHPSSDPLNSRPPSP